LQLKPSKYAENCGGWAGARSNDLNPQSPDFAIQESYCFFEIDVGFSAVWVKRLLDGVVTYRGYASKPRTDNRSELISNS
jgi:hypothetical protein